MPLQTMRHLSRLDLRQLEVVTAYLDSLLSGKNRTLPSEVAGEGLLRIESLVEDGLDAGGDYAAVLRACPRLSRSDKEALLEVATSLRDKLLPQRPNYQGADGYHARANLQGFVTFKYVKKRRPRREINPETGEEEIIIEEVFYGPYGYHRFNMVGGGRNRKKKRLGSRYLGRSWGFVIERIVRSHDAGLLNTDERKVFDRAVVYALWTEQDEELLEILTSAMWLLAGGFIETIEEAIGRGRNAINEDMTTQARAEVFLNMLSRLLRERTNNEQIRRFQAMRQARGHQLSLAPMLPIEAFKPTGREPGRLRIVRPARDAGD